MINPALKRSANRVARLSLLTTACAASFAYAAPAFAEGGALAGTGAIADIRPEAHANLTAVLPEAQTSFVAPVVPEAQTYVNPVEPVRHTAFIDPTEPEPEILIANPGTPTTARDTGINGIGQMVVDSGGGFIGLCTGTLINPRTVIFAAHCVNSRAATDYGANSGGTGIAFGFEAFTRANGPGQVDELRRWLIGEAGTGAGRFQTNLAQAFFNVNQVVYNEFSLEPASRGFLYGDVALATLDTPAANIPTWALLFSPLSAPGTISQTTGTGYNVGIFGYGGNGTGTSGTFQIDFRRRAAENVIGALTDLDTFEAFLFGEPPTGLSQNLYFIDFDDPLRGTNGASIFDFNAFKDDARIKNGAPSEGTTAGGDSGGPLVLQNFSKQLVIGVLSGGYTRFFNGQSANGYGTVSFYQPLYLYWDWIAANNPYHYVSAKAGDGSWTDPTRWVTTLDPSYYILSGGQPVNGIPTVAGEQANGTSGDFGQICFQSAFFGSDDCYDTGTGQFLTNGQPAGDASDGLTIVDLDGNVIADARGNGLINTRPTAQAGAPVLPTATLANGLPGASNFVPNNSDPVRATGVLARYFDVTLTAAGTTTLSGADITIDRLTLGAAGANLTIASGASLTSLINVNHFAGILDVNGTLTSVGDYSFFGGAIAGNGRINAPFVTSVMGTFNPGTSTSVGRLTIGGNLVMASGTNYVANLGSSGLNDRIVVVANGTSTGAANVGGTLSLSLLPTYRPADGDKFTVLTAAGGVTGTFANPITNFTPILFTKVGYTATSVTVEVDAGLYANVIDRTSPIQVAFAQLLDQNRSNYANLSGLYRELDLLNQAGIRGTLESLAPRTPSMNLGAGVMATDVLGRFFRDRMANASDGEMGGTVAMYGRPLQLAALNANDAGTEVMSDVGSGMVDTGMTTDEDSALYLAAGYINGSGVGLASATPGGRNQFDGFYITAGIEHAVSDTGFLGFGFSYADLDGSAPQGLAETGGTLYQGTVYGAAHIGDKGLIDFQANGGLYNFSSARNVQIGLSPFTLTANDEALAFSSELGFSLDTAGTGPVDITPRVSLRYSTIGFHQIDETGGAPAMSYDFGTIESWQARAGLSAKGTFGTVRPYLSANYVFELKDQPAGFASNFTLGTGPAVIFGFGESDKSWGELAGGLTIGSENVSASLSAETTVLRSDYRNQTYRASVTWRF
jgi:uncharacterized protein YhjY with autotransporter beta-barrel domain